MGDIEVLKLIINGGSFALLVIIVLWALFKFSPQQTVAMQNMVKDGAEAQKTAAADHKTTMQAMAAAHQASVAAIMQEFRNAMATQHKECREERKEMLLMLQDIAEKDRAARHTQNNDFQRAIAEMYENARKERGG